MDQIEQVTIPVTLARKIRQAVNLKLAITTDLEEYTRWTNILRVLNAAIDAASIPRHDTDKAGG